MEKILYTEDEIKDAVKRLAAELNNIHNENNEDQVVMVPLLQGAVNFFADLSNHLAFNPYVEYLGVSSYEGEEQTEFNIYRMPKLETIIGRTVWLVDDLLDSGNTIEFISKLLLQFGAKEVRVCVLIRKTHSKVKGDLVGFEMGDEWIWGYGMDAPNGRGRLLKSIWCKSE